MTEKVRYEVRDFFHYLTEADGIELAPFYQLIEPLERICLDFGGILSASHDQYCYTRIGDRNVNSWNKEGWFGGKKERRCSAG